MVKAHILITACSFDLNKFCFLNNFKLTLAFHYLTPTQERLSYRAGEANNEQVSLFVEFTAVIAQTSNSRQTLSYLVSREAYLVTWCLVFTYSRVPENVIHQLFSRTESSHGGSPSTSDHDEIYQANRPVLVGMDHRSMYCYLLAVEDSCDETTWGVHLLDLSDHGLYLERTIADGDCLKAVGSTWALACLLSLNKVDS